MKKITPFLCLILLFAMVVLFVGCNLSEKNSDDYLRIHIRANSNSDADQNVKLKVRDKVVKYLTPLLYDLSSVADAKRVVEKNADKIVALCNEVLEQNGFYYGSNCSIKREVFPTRSYGDLTLQSGEYDAVIINLGEGNGDNWWCVAFPPLCFVNGDEDAEYRSFVADWLKNRR